MNRQINPTRMELTKLKNQLQMTTRGHKLLKDKQDEMIRRFMLIIDDAKKLRTEVNHLLSLVMQDYKESIARSSKNTLYEALVMPGGEVKLTYKRKNIMSVYVPDITIKEHIRSGITYSLYSTPATLDQAVLRLEDLLPKLIELASIDKAVDMLSSEIEKTRRRVNAIEFIMMPELEENIKRIQMKLDDNERSNTVRMMKSKEIITKRHGDSHD